MVEGGPPGEIAQLRFPRRAVDFGIPVAGERVEPGVAPRANPVDPFRQDHPLLEKKAKDVCLEELASSGDIDMRRPKEVAVDGGRAGRRQDVQVGVPVEEIPRRLDRHDRTGESLSAGVGAERLGSPFRGRTRPTTSRASRSTTGRIGVLHGGKDLREDPVRVVPAVPAEGERPGEGGAGPEEDEEKGDQDRFPGHGTIVPRARLSSSRPVRALRFICCLVPGASA
jgi:hypothetical protein